MYATVERYQTADGKLFVTEREAEAHIVDLVSKEINELLLPLLSRYTGTDLFRFISQLVPDAQAGLALGQSILKHYRAP